jgi:DNA-binding transcriptional LysR family regulator
MNYIKIFLKDKIMLDDIDIFIAIVDSGSFVQAAKNLKTTQATVSRRLQVLERNLGFNLMVRNTRSYEITRAGLELYQGYKNHQLALSGLIDNLKSNQNLLTGRIRISLPVVIPYNIITPYLGEFMQNNPGLELEICYQSNKVDLLRDNFDIAIINYRPDQQTLRLRRIFQITINAYCSPEYKQRYGVPQDIHSLDRHLVIGGIKSDLTANQTLYSRYISGREYPLHHIRLFSNNLLHSKKIALQGHAIVIGWDEIFVDELSQGKLEKILPDYDFGTINFYLIRPNRAENKAVNLLIEFLNQCFKNVEKDETSNFLEVSNNVISD